MTSKITLPHAIQTICSAINSVGKAVVVGGYVRDRLLGLESFDVDIEVYEVAHLASLEAVLHPFGALHEVGKSFGVIVLAYEAYSFDITLARKENKIGIGHRGFEISSEPFESFETIARRRDFTINAMGFDSKNGSFLDPFGGEADLSAKRLRFIDRERFAEDPLRVLRAVGFIARFELTPDTLLIEVCAQMVREGQLDELSSERIYSEIKKWFMKAEKPSLGFEFLAQIGSDFFSEVRDRSHTLAYLDRGAHFAEKLCLLYLLTPIETALEALERWCTHTKLLKEIILLHRGYHAWAESDKSDYALKKIAVLLPLKKLCPIVSAVDSEQAQSVEHSAHNLSIWEGKVAPLVTGKELIKAGFIPSENFGLRLEALYDLQLREPALTKEALMASLQKA